LLIDCLIATRCDEDGLDLSASKNFSLPQLMEFYQAISFSESPMSESFFREYFDMEKAFTLETKKFLEEVYRKSSSNCITKSNLLVIARAYFTKVSVVYLFYFFLSCLV
jgi:hypothetical protein